MSKWNCKLVKEKEIKIEGKYHFLESCKSPKEYVNWFIFLIFGGPKIFTVQLRVWVYGLRGKTLHPMSPGGLGTNVLQNGMHTSAFFLGEILPFFDKEIGKLLEFFFS